MGRRGELWAGLPAFCMSCSCTQDRQFKIVIGAAVNLRHMYLQGDGLNSEPRHKYTQDDQPRCLSTAPAHLNVYDISNLTSERFRSIV